MPFFTIHKPFPEAANIFYIIYITQHYICNGSHNCQCIHCESLIALGSQTFTYRKVSL